MSWRRAKTRGWAAFDPKNQQKQVTNNETHNDPYPPISSNISTWHHPKNPSRNSDLTGRSFSSVLTPSASVPDMMASEDAHIPLDVVNIQNFPNSVRDASDLAHTLTLMENSRSEKMTTELIESNVSQLYEKLKELHPWANKNLIEDIMAAVDNDIDKASTLLKEMASPGSLHAKKGTEFEDNIEEVDLDGLMPKDTGLNIGENSLVIKNDEPLIDCDCSGKVLVNDNVPLRLLMDSLSMIPVEPEWEDDDMYLMHRKEAIRAMRLASRYSKAAKEAYVRRDHAAAQELSIKAQEEWINSEKLNDEAAKEILRIRNSENDDWKLDLHGLHATEAVQVLLQHLIKIESQSTKPHKTSLKLPSSQTKSLESEKLDRQQQQSSRPRLLEVITGKGSHSRGQAALPVAIKNFLSEKGCAFFIF